MAQLPLGRRVVNAKFEDARRLWFLRGRQNLRREFGGAKEYPLSGIVRRLRPLLHLLEGGLISRILANSFVRRFHLFESRESRQHQRQRQVLSDNGREYPECVYIPRQQGHLRREKPIDT